MGPVSLSASVLVTTAKDRPSSHLLQSKEAFHVAGNTEVGVGPLR